MTAKKKPPKGDEDPAQSKRFLDVVRELEADGDLSPTEGEAALDELVRRGAVKQIGSIPDAE